jgi:serine/threonine-protein kinase
MSTATDSVLPAPLDGRFELIRPIQETPTRLDWMARDKIENRAVQLTLFPQLRGDRGEVVITRAQAVARVDHPNLVKILEAGATQDNTPFVVSELHGEETLAARLQRRPPPSRSDLVSWGAQTARGLAALHSAGQLHRDVRPTAIRLKGNETACLGDFGFGRPEILPDSVDEDSQLPGTAALMAPELWLGAAPDPLSEQFSLAAAIYMTRYRQPVYPAFSNAEILQLVKVGFAVENLGDPSKHPPGLEHALARALARDPARRFADLASFAAALEQDSGEEPKPPSSADRPARVSPKGRTTSRIVLPRPSSKQQATRRVYLWVIAVSMVICLGLAWLLTQPN